MNFFFLVFHIDIRAVFQNMVEIYGSKLSNVIWIFFSVFHIDIRAVFQNMVAISKFYNSVWYSCRNVIGYLSMGVNYISYVVALCWKHQKTSNKTVFFGHEVHASMKFEVVIVNFKKQPLFWFKYLENIMTFAFTNLFSL